MRRDDDRFSMGAECIDEPGQPLFGGGVEPERRFVEREDLRIHRQDGCDADTLLLPDREGKRRGGKPQVLDAETLARTLDPLLYHVTGSAEICRGKSKLLGDGLPEELVIGMLADQADGAGDLGVEGEGDAIYRRRDFPRVPERDDPRAGGLRP